MNEPHTKQQVFTVRKSDLPNLLTFVLQLRHNLLKRELGLCKLGIAEEVLICRRNLVPKCLGIECDGWRDMNSAFPNRLSVRRQQEQIVDEIYD